MTTKTRTLKSFSLEEIETAIETAISELTGTNVKAAINTFSKSEFDYDRANRGVDGFNFSTVLEVGVSYSVDSEGEEEDSF